MKGALEFITFAGASVAIHAVVLHDWVEPRGATAGAGAGGQSVLTLAAVAPSLSAQVADWRRAPTADLGTPAPDLPEIETVPSGLVSRVDRAVLPATDPGRGLAPVLPDGGLSGQVTTPPPPKPKPVQSKPEPPIPAKRKQTASAPKPSEPQPSRKAETARGAAPETGASSGQTVRKQVASAISTVSKAEIAEWGARIRARIERRKKSPGGAWASGSATLRIKVTRDGGLAGLGVVKSSGDARLDRAALDAVKRAGRFPPAPNGLASGAMTFDLPVSFVR